MCFLNGCSRGRVLAFVIKSFKQALLKQAAQAPAPSISVSAPTVPQSAADKAEREKDMEELMNLKKDHAKFNDSGSPASASPETTPSAAAGGFPSAGPGNGVSVGGNVNGGAAGGGSVGLNFHNASPPAMSSPTLGSPGMGSPGGISPRGGYGSPLSTGSIGARNSTSPIPRPRTSTSSRSTPSYMRGTASSKKKK